MNKSVLIQTILQNHTVVDYLSSKGYEPARSYGGRYKYSCPLHGPEKDPSFYVFTHKEYQYYHCFGCRNHGDIINLVAKIEGTDLRNAIGKLAQGLKISDKDLVEQLAVDIESRESKIDMSVEEICLRLSRSFYDYLEMTSFDPNEVRFMESVFQQLDKIILAMDYELLREIYDKIIDEAMPTRIAKYTKRKEAKTAAHYVKANYAS